MARKFKHLYPSTGKMACRKCVYCGQRQVNAKKRNATCTHSPGYQRTQREVQLFSDPDLDPDFDMDSYSTLAQDAGDKVKSTRGQSFKKRSARCLDTHPELKIGGGIFYGGSCGHPTVHDADIYIGFQSGMAHSNRRFPWHPGHEIDFRVTDYHAPDKKDEGAYVKLVDWTVAQLATGARVHAGCIGGHGRTGMFLAAVLARLGVSNPIAHARSHYCDRAVESVEQVNFLVRVFGCEKVDPAKTRVIGGTGVGDWENEGSSVTWRSPVERYRNKFGTPKAPYTESIITIKPTPTSGHVWGKTLKPENY